MADSVLGVMMSNIYGMPVTGATIGGLIGNTSADLLARWYQVGAFYPFSMNDNLPSFAPYYQLPRDPYMFNTTYYHTISYTDIIRNGMQTKLALLNYYYTEITMLHEEGGTFFRPLFFDFPNE